MKEYTDQYLNRLKALIPIHDDASGRFLSHIESLVDEYLEEYPNATYLELVKRFGEPQLLADSYLSEQDPRDLIESTASDKKSTNRWIFCSIFLIILVIGIFVIRYYYTAHTNAVKNVPTVYMETVPDVISTEDSENSNTQGE